MKRGITAAMVAGTVAMAPVAAAEAAPTRGKLVVDARINHEDVHLNEAQGINPPNQQPDVGETIMGSGVVFRKGTERRIGTTHFFQALTRVDSVGSQTEPPDLITLTYGVTKVPGGKIYAMIDLGADPEKVEKGAIVGGTGKYRGARGEFTDRVLRFEETFQLSRQTFRFSR